MQFASNWAQHHLSLEYKIVGTEQWGYLSFLMAHRSQLGTRDGTKWKAYS